MATFQHGNQAAATWTEEAAVELLLSMCEFAMHDDDVLCFTDACVKAGYSPSHVNYLVDRFPVLVDIKKDVQNYIASRINKGALTGGYVATPAIWRMKQLGEKDQQFQEVTGKDGTAVTQPVFIFKNLNEQHT